MNWLKNFMVGRYGADHLSIALIILSVILTFFGSAADLAVLVVLSYIPLITAIFRMFSKNVNKRRLENYKFLTLMSPVYSGSLKLIARIKDSRTHRIFKCPKCKAKLRVPKGKGKICITCSLCKTEFVKKS